MKLLITGGAGFIGSNFARLALQRWEDCELVVFDKLTYAGNRDNLLDISADTRFSFVQGDICDERSVEAAMDGCTHVVNFAAETHVDRSILDAADFVRTDVEGTRVLLEASRRHQVTRYLQVSTDEVYGEVENPSRASEDWPARPRSPYAASKAGGDLMTLAYVTTYGVDAVVTRGANTYGPYQYPEKIVPLFITNALEGLPLPLYGDGQHMRDWLFVDDHCRGIAIVLEKGDSGEIYNLGAGCERPNREVADVIVRLTGVSADRVRRVEDRPGHDRRYALDTAKAQRLGWRPEVSFDEGMELTVRWYQDHPSWWKIIRRGEFRDYYRIQYESRLAESSA